MTQTEFDVAIVGGGLSGLVAAWRLVQQGRSVVILEARNRLGGRILTVGDDAGLGTFELGPAWFWQEHRHVQRLMQTLGIEPFPQFETGDALFDRGIGQPPQRFIPDWEIIPSYRFAGGVTQLIEELASQLPDGSVRLDCQVKRIEQSTDHLGVEFESDNGAEYLRAVYVVITLPPRLAAQTLHFEPSLPAEVVQAMLNTQTWMGQAMKIVLAYPTPFWRAVGLSGLAVSHVGAVQQFHDHTPADGRCGALFGWIGNGTNVRTLSAPTRKQLIIEQATRLFGSEAAKPTYFAEMNWANEPFTRFPEAMSAEQEHPRYGHPRLQTAQMNGRLHWAGTEVSTVNGGYLDGAIYAGEEVVRRLITILGDQQSH